MIWTALLTARSFLAKIPWPVWAIAAVLLTGWLYGNHRYSEGYDDREAEYAAARAKAVEQARTTDRKASDRRAADATRLTNDSNARKEAIDNAEPDTTDAAGRALACQRLRAAGIDPPAECG